MPAFRESYEFWLVLSALLETYIGYIFFPPIWSTTIWPQLLIQKVPRHVYNLKQKKAGIYVYEFIKHIYIK